MPILVTFEVKGNTAAKYDEAIRRLTAAGELHPDGQLYHICYGDPQNLQVIDVFESREKLDGFGAKLGPLLQEMGIEATPTISEIYNIIK